MAHIPVAGFPDTGGKPDRVSGRVLKLYGADAAEKALLETLVTMPVALKAALKEIGLFGERETKLATPVQFGLLRAAIGHFEPGQIHLPATPSDEGDAAQAVRQELESTARHAKDDAVFEVEILGKELSVTWGTNVHYGPYIEDGFTMSSKRLVYIWGVGFRWVHPFSYRGARMFEKGLAAASYAAGPIISHWVLEGFKAAGVDI